MSQIVTPHAWTRLQCHLLAPTVVQRSDDGWSAFLDHRGTWRIDASFAFQASWHYGGAVELRLRFEHGQIFNLGGQWLGFAWKLGWHSARMQVRTLLHYHRKRRFGRGSPRDGELFMQSRGGLWLNGSLLITIDQPQSVELFAYTSGDITQAQASDVILMAHRVI